jgi:putative membrane protein
VNRGASGRTTAPTTTRTDPFRAGLAFGLAVLSLWAAILPVSRFDWFMENVLVWIAVVVIVRWGDEMRMSRTAYLLIALFLALQIYASHYAYRPPIGDWVSAIVGSPRNSFDRVIHLFFGLLLFIPLMECFEGAAGMTRRAAMFCSLLAISAFGAAYEVIEWGMMVVLNPSAGAEFVGMQGDPWDAQKDMALALLGSVATYIGVALRRRRA